MVAVAVPAVVVYVTACDLAVEPVRVSWMAMFGPFSLTCAVALSNPMVLSSSAMVTVLTLFTPTTAPPVGDERVMVKSLADSRVVLLITGMLLVDSPTVMFFAVASPDAQLSVPVRCAVLPSVPKSVPATAALLPVVQVTLTAPVAEPVRFTATFTLVVAPSVTLAVVCAKESADSSSRIATVVVTVAPRTAPPSALLMAAVKVRVPSTIAFWVIGTGIVLSATSPSAQLRVPVTVV